MTTDTERFVEQRARGIAAMGHVSRYADGFTVYSTADPGAFRVWEDGHVGVRCSCERFDRGLVRDEAYRCEHMRAVELALSGGESQPYDELDLPRLLRPAV